LIDPERGRDALNHERPAQPILATARASPKSHASPGHPRRLANRAAMLPARLRREGLAPGDGQVGMRTRAGIETASISALSSRSARIGLKDIGQGGTVSCVRSVAKQRNP
jgi:hypothetical protein